MSLFKNVGRYVFVTFFGFTVTKISQIAGSVSPTNSAKEGFIMKPFRKGSK